MLRKLLSQSNVSTSEFEYCQGTKIFGQAEPADYIYAVIEGAVQRLRPKLMTVCAVLASLVPILWESGIGSDVMKPIAAPIVGGMITSTIHVLILVPVFFVLMKERALRRGTLRSQKTNGAT